MYTKSRGITSEKTGFAVPPGYDGNRFQMDHEGNYTENIAVTDEMMNDESTKENVTSGDTALQFLRNIGKEELLIIALIIILAGEKQHVESETVLMLALLLCAP